MEKEGSILFNPRKEKTAYSNPTKASPTTNHDGKVEVRSRVLHRLRMQLSEFTEMMQKPHVRADPRRCYRGRLRYGSSKRWQEQVSGQTDRQFARPEQNCRLTRDRNCLIGNLLGK